MNFQKAAFLDETAGRFLVWCVSHFPPYPKDIPRGVSFERILVMKFFGSGTILQATPFLAALKRSYPGASIDLLTFPENRQIAESLDLFQTVHVVNWRSGLVRLFWDTAGFVIRNTRKYSLVVDLEFFACYSALLAKMLAGTWSLGFESFMKGRTHCYSRTVIFDHSNHVRHVFLKFLDCLDLPRPATISLAIPRVPEASKTKVDGKTPALHGNAHRIAVNINAGEMCTNRRWPEEHFRKLIELLQKDISGLVIYLTGGREDVAAVRRFHDSLANREGVHILAGELDILEFSHALSNMHIFVTSDSGPMHIAEAVGVPVVCFFGPETPNVYGPLSPDSLVFYSNRHCSPCLNTYNHKRVSCNDNQCLKIISPEEVHARMIAAYRNKTWSAAGAAPGSGERQ